MSRRSTSRRLTSGEFTVGGFAWSPDGTRIAFDHRVNGDNANGGTADISIVTVADEAVRPLVTQEGPDTDPVWSPDGARIAFETTMANPSYLLHEQRASRRSRRQAARSRPVDGVRRGSVAHRMEGHGICGFPRIREDDSISLPPRPVDEARDEDRAGRRLDWIRRSACRRQAKPRHSSARARRQFPDDLSSPTGATDRRS